MLSASLTPAKTLRFASILVAVSAALGTALTLWGLRGLEWHAFPYHFFFIVTAFVMLWASHQSGAGRPWTVGLVLAGLLALASGNLWPLLAVLWFGTASVLLGQYLLLKLPAQVQPWPNQLLVGAGAYGTLVGLLAHLPVAYSGTYGGLLALPVLLGRKTLTQWYQALRGVTAAVTTASSAPPAQRWLDYALASTALVYFLVALMPEVGHDALAMHLFIPAHLEARHAWGFDASTYVWAVMPMLGDWIFSIPYLLAGESAARLVNVGFIFLLTWLVRDVVLWAGGSALGARWAMLILLSTPLTFTEGSSLFIESIWTAFVVAGTLSVFKACASKEYAGQELTLGGAMLGMALAAKAVTLPLLPVLMLMLVVRHKVWLTRGNHRYWLAGLGWFAVLGFVPYVTAWWLTGNPIFPFFNAIFKSPLWEPVNFEATAFGKGIPWDFLYSITFGSGRFLEARAGAGGFQWLLLFLPLSLGLAMTRHWRAMGLICFGLLSTALVFHSTSYLRYVFPAYAVLAAVIGVGIEASKNWQPRLSGLITAAGTIAVGLNLLYLSAGAFFDDFPIASAFSQGQRKLYQEEKVPIRQAIALVNELNLKQSPVAVFAEPMAAGLQADGLFATWYNAKWQFLFFEAKSEAALAQILLDKGVSWLIVDARWNAMGNVSKEQLGLLSKVSEERWKLGPIAVRRLKDDFRFKTELLLHPDFADIAPWTLSPGARYDVTHRTLLVNVVAPATQTTRIVLGREYEEIVQARCHELPAQGRLQINWSDAQDKFIQASIEVFDCAHEWKEHRMRVTPPPGAASATVYATGHSAIPLEFKLVSLRK
jgi:hypothetical protein